LRARGKEEGKKERREGGREGGREGREDWRESDKSKGKCHLRDSVSFSPLAQDVPSLRPAPSQADNALTFPLDA
jgi:hypothetical protein